MFDRENAQIIRYGGDEFIVWLNSEQLIDHTFTHFFEQLNPVVVCAGALTNSCTLSVGIAKCDGEISFATLFEHADKALYKAKEARRSCFIIYN